MKYNKIIFNVYELDNLFDNYTNDEINYLHLLKFKMPILNFNFIVKIYVL